jgi:hypothetical protein
MVPAQPAHLTRRQALAAGATERGPDNRHRGADQWLFVVSGSEDFLVQVAVPEHGSLGASGDLAPMAHVAPVQDMLPVTEVRRQ